MNIKHVRKGTTILTVIVFVQRLLGYSEKEGGEGGWQRPGGSDLLR